MTTKQKRQKAIELYHRTHDILALQRFLGLKTIRAAAKYATAERNLYLPKNPIMTTTPHRQGCGDFQKVAEVRYLSPF